MKKRGVIVLIAIAVLVGLGVLVAQLHKGKETSTDANKSEVTADANKHYKVGLAQIVEHPSLNTIRDAFLDRMAELGYEDGKNITYLKDQANGEINILTTIMQRYDTENVDIIVPIATPTAVAAAPYAKKRPVVFSAVSDPVSAQLVSSLEKPDKNITGTSDVIQIEKILELAKRMYPEMKKIGFLYNASEANSVSNIQKAKEFCDANGIQYQEANVSMTVDLPQATQVLLQDCDMVFSPNDNTVASGIDAVVNACIKAKKPFFVGADSMVADGGLATVGINYEALGKKTADMVDAIFKGKKVEDIPVMEFKDGLNLYVNTKVAQQIGYSIPEDLKNEPNYVEVQ